MDISTQYHAYHQQGTRPPSAIRYVGLHSTESPADSARGVAIGFTSRASGGSSHFVVDNGNTAYRCLPDNVIPWAAPPLNSNGVHIEMCGYAHWTEAQWMAERATLENAAKIVRAWCTRYHIPVAWIGPAGLKAGHPGITRHLDITAAFHQTDHTDPGTGFPVSTFLSMVRGVDHDMTPTEVREAIDTALEAQNAGVVLRIAGKDRPDHNLHPYEARGWSLADDILKAP